MARETWYQVMVQLNQSNFEKQICWKLVEHRAVNPVVGRGRSLITFMISLHLVSVSTRNMH